MDCSEQGKTCTQKSGRKRGQTDEGERAETEEKVALLGCRGSGPTYVRLRRRSLKTCFDRRHADFRSKTRLDPSLSAPFLLFQGAGKSGR